MQAIKQSTLQAVQILLEGFGARDDCEFDIHECELSGRIIPELLHHRISIVLVNRSLGVVGGYIEKLRERADFAPVDIIL